MITMVADDWICERALLFANEKLPPRPVIWHDTSNFMSIERGHVIMLEGVPFLVRSNEHEGRFGIDDQPKFWVKHAIDLSTGNPTILKLVFDERFRIHVGPLQIKCWRSPEKEARVLELVRGDARFMQGHTAYDAGGNLVRVIDWIPGADLLRHLAALPERHRDYCEATLPTIVSKLAVSFAAIQLLHDAGLCHGDIRNDHLFVDRRTGAYRWIDFDLNQDSAVFDVWSAGNILHYVVAKGFLTFRDATTAVPECSRHLTHEDACVFFAHRIMNLRQVYPYLPVGLNAILQRFSFGSRIRYDRMSQIADDLAECAEAMGRTRAPESAG